MGAVFVLIFHRPISIWTFGNAEFATPVALLSAFMASAVLTAGAAYAIRAFLGNSIGFEAAGLYQSAWALGGLYVGIPTLAKAS